MNEDQHDEQLPLPFPDDPDFQTHTRPSGQPGGTPVPGPALVTLVIQGHSDIPLRCCQVPKPSPTQVSEWGETLVVYCANCSQELLQVVGPPVSVTGWPGLFAYPPV